MKLEIDIPSILYQDAKENRNYISLTKLEIAWKAIADGKPIEQEPVLDKIRTEIEEYKSRQLTLAIGVADLEEGKQIALEYVLAIIDKYKAESEG